MSCALINSQQTALLQVRLHNAPSSSQVLIHSVFYNVLKHLPGVFRLDTVGIEVWLPSQPEDRQSSANHGGQNARTDHLKRGCRLTLVTSRSIAVQFSRPPGNMARVLAETVHGQQVEVEVEGEGLVHGPAFVEGGEDGGGHGGAVDRGSGCAAFAVGFVAGKQGLAV